MLNVLETVTTYIEQHQLLPTSGELIVAVSGGADSLCLLHLLQQLCGLDKHYPELQLHVAHLNHQLCAEASAQDAAAVARIATAWGLPVTIGEVDVPALAHSERRSLEDAARTARYHFLREVAHGQPIAVAHHADDQIETVLLHWLRGGGLASMVGMSPRQGDIIRPLLAIHHADTLAYCRQHHIVPLEDASNTDPRFLRNRIRHQLLPLLESVNPGIRATILRNTEVMRVDAEWIEAQVDACWPTVVITRRPHSPRYVGSTAFRSTYAPFLHQIYRVPTRITLKLEALLALPLSIQRHLLRRVTAQLCGGQSPLELRHHLLIEEFLHRGNAADGHTLHMPQRLHLTRTSDTVVLEQQQKDVESSSCMVGVGLAPTLETHLAPALETLAPTLEHLAPALETCPKVAPMRLAPALGSGNSDTGEESAGYPGG